MLKGLPLALMDGTDLYYIVNWTSNLGSLWWTARGEQASRDEMIRRARKIVDLYLEWNEKGQVPVWFRAARSISRN